MQEGAVVSKSVEDFGRDELDELGRSIFECEGAAQDRLDR